MVIVYEPLGVAAAVATVRVEDPEPVTEVGLNVPVAPVGRPLTVKVTAALKPFKAVTVGVKLVLLPWITVCELGDAASEKLGAAFTTRMAVALCVRLPLVPVMVRRVGTGRRGVRCRNSQTSRTRSR